ncbi:MULTISPECIES: aminotransferase class I/II-fold pyridoxal phosphate-dependent enzyme [Synechococcales]|uniref:aminotransferase class I/II-fold pyridoxal phosphate-dependent enzyme n=1 Tax=Synechococcus sp. CS-1333 TaxID=2848638 RepID=UPI00223A844F|nr:aminotransferase class I/II-fold pyridoxal phosphate-dependent enzyme [Synechococcus sp. CS-1333]
MNVLPAGDPADPLSSLWPSLSRVPPDRRRRLRSFATTAGGGLKAVVGAGEAAAPLLDLASNDYLGFSHHPLLQQAACDAIARDGTGSGASPLVTGTRPVHTLLAETLANWLGRGQVLLFPSGFQANLAAVLALTGRHGVVLADRLIHHSLLLGVQASGARLLRFRHNDSADLERRLIQQRTAEPQRPTLVITESLFSMEGTSPDLAAIARICRQQRSRLLVDEAHGLGVLGPGGRGLAHGLAGVSLVSGTFGKAFGSGGAFLAADAPLADWLLQSSGAFRYSTALAPCLAAAALAALELLQQDPGLGQTLLTRAERWRCGLAAAGWQRPEGTGPVLPLLVGNDGAALALQAQLERAGLLSVAIRPPTVPEGTSRLRLVLSRSLPTGTLARLLAALGTPVAGVGR